MADQVQPARPPAGFDPDVRRGSVIISGRPEALLQAVRLQGELFRGASRGELWRVTRCLERKAFADSRNAIGMTPFMVAASCYCNEGVRVLLLLAEKRADLEDRDHRSWTALHHACRNGREEMVKALLELQADATCLAGPRRQTGLMLAALEGNPDLVRRLLKLDDVRNQIDRRDEAGLTAVHNGTISGNVAVLQILLEKNAKVNVADGEGRTALMLAGEGGKIDIAKRLIKFSAGLHTECFKQRTALIYACLNIHDQFGIFLIQKKANMFHTDFLGKNAIEYAEQKGMGEFAWFVEGESQRLRREARGTGVAKSLQFG